MSDNVTSSLLITAENWTQPKCPSAGDEINKSQCPQAVQCFSAAGAGDLQVHITKTKKLDTMDYAFSDSIDTISKDR